MRKLRVLTKEYKKKKYDGAQKNFDNHIKEIVGETYGNTVIIKKLERIEGNDIINMLEEGIFENDLNKDIRLKEIHVTGRMAKKIISSDRIQEGGFLSMPKQPEFVCYINGIPIIYNNDDFKEIEEHYWLHRENPTGEEEWLNEIKFIYE